uniref:FlxA-like protein n=1 Tax=Globodera pallida TaxID=36090 RepID=A0A183BUH7_GLOPA
MRQSVTVMIVTSLTRPTTGGSAGAMSDQITFEPQKGREELHQTKEELKNTKELGDKKLEQMEALQTKIEEYQKKQQQTIDELTEKLKAEARNEAQNTQSFAKLEDEVLSSPDRIQSPPIPNLGPEFEQF